MRAAETRTPGGNRANAEENTISSRQCTAETTATKAQRDRILEALRRRPQTTCDLRRLGIFQAATRIKELRERGYRIETSRVTVVDADGYAHARAALYSLVEGRGQ